MFMNVPRLCVLCRVLCRMINNDRLTGNRPFRRFLFLYLDNFLHLLFFTTKRVSRKKDSYFSFANERSEQSLSSKLIDTGCKSAQE